MSPVGVSRIPSLSGALNAFAPIASVGSSSQAPTAQATADIFVVWEPKSQDIDLLVGTARGRLTNNYRRVCWEGGWEADLRSSRNAGKSARTHNKLGHTCSFRD
jgi:hypothetical protein